jgi:type IV pilus assembly protein PilA
LAAIVIVAINPTKQLGDARNAQRKSDVNTILSATWQYAIDHGGNTPDTISTVVRPVCQVDFALATCVTALNGVSLRMLSGTYLVSIPKDPQVTATGTGTRYNISRDANGRITVSAPARNRARRSPSADNTLFGRLGRPRCARTGGFLTPSSRARTNGPLTLSLLQVESK